jgi:hypothetical protein
MLFCSTVNNADVGSTLFKAVFFFLVHSNNCNVLKPTIPKPIVCEILISNKYSIIQKKYFKI